MENTPKRFAGQFELPFWKQLGALCNNRKNYRGDEVTYEPHNLDTHYYKSPLRHGAHGAYPDGILMFSSLEQPWH